MSLEYLARQLPDPIRNRPYIAIPGGQMALAAIRHLYRPAAHARLHPASRPSIGQQQQQQPVPRYLSRCQPASTPRYIQQQQQQQQQQSLLVEQDLHSTDKANRPDFMGRKGLPT